MLNNTKRLMILSLIGFGLTACGSSGGSNDSSPAPKSLLINTWDFVGAVAQIDGSGTFTLSQTSPTTCVEAGTWVDHNPGANSGTVTFTSTYNSCTGHLGPVTDNYTISNGTLVLSN